MRLSRDAFGALVATGVVAAVGAVTIRAERRSPASVQGDVEHVHGLDKGIAGFETQLRIMGLKPRARTRLVFVGPLPLPVATALEAWERDQVEELGRFGFDRVRSAKEWLNDAEWCRDVERWAVRTGAGDRGFDMWCCTGDAALLFCAGSAEVVGKAIQHGFEMADRSGRRLAARCRGGGACTRRRLDGLERSEALLGGGGDEVVEVGGGVA
jgi:hypothetical protein